jgi:hypothetical protein
MTRLVDVACWDAIAPVLDQLFLHTGSGYTLAVRVTALYGSPPDWQSAP